MFNGSGSADKYAFAHLTPEQRVIFQQIGAQRDARLAKQASEYDDLARPATYHHDASGLIDIKTREQREVAALLEKYRQEWNQQHKYDGVGEVLTLAALTYGGVSALNGAGAGTAATGNASGGLLGSGAIEGAAGVTEGLGASMAANGAAVANSTLAALPQAGFTIGEGLAAGAAGGAAASGGFGQLAGSSVGEAFGAGAAPEMGSGLLGQSGALAQGAAGTGYVSPFATGSITGASGMAPITGAGLADIAATTGLNTTGLAAGAGVSAGLLEGATPLEPKGLLEKAGEWVQENPKTTYDIAKTLLGAAAGSTVGNQSGSSVNTSTAFTPFTPNQFQYAPIVPEWAKQKGLL